VKRGVAKKQKNKPAIAPIVAAAVFLLQVKTAFTDKRFNEKGVIVAIFFLFFLKKNKFSRENLENKAKRSVAPRQHARKIFERETQPEEQIVPGG